MSVSVPVASPADAVCQGSPGSAAVRPVGAPTTGDRCDLSIHRGGQNDRGGGQNERGGGQHECGNSTSCPSLPARPRPSLADDLWQLTKPRIVMMVLITTVIAGLVAGGGTMPLALWLHLLLGVGLVAGSAGAMNQVWEHRVDRLMARTRWRPLAAQRIGFTAGLLFAGGLGVAGTAYLWYFTGAVPAWVAVATWISYVPLYTPLKQISEWNTTVGAVSGALPTMIGYTAAGGGLGDAAGWLLVGALFAWQYPHFMAIAWRCREEYAAAGFQMTTTIDTTGKRAGRQSVGGMLFLNACLIALVVLIMTPAAGWLIALMSLAMVAASYPMSLAAWRFAGQPSDATARKLLRASIIQLPASLGLLTVIALVWGH